MDALKNMTPEQREMIQKMMKQQKARQPVVPAAGQGARRPARLRIERRAGGLV